MANSVQRTVKRNVKRAAKRNPVALALAIVFLLLGLAVGDFGGKALTKNDAFTLKGNKAVAYTVGDGGGSVTFEEPGWTLTALGRDASGTVTAETELEAVDGGYKIDTSKPGTYTIVYQSSQFLFSKYKLVRTVTVAAAEGGAD